MKDKIEFIANLAPIKGAIRIDGTDEMRVVLDVPKIEIPNAVGLIAFQSKAFKVTVEAI